MKQIAISKESKKRSASDHSIITKWHKEIESLEFAIAYLKSIPPVNFSLMANQARERQSSLAQNLDRAETLIWNKLLARDF